MIAEVATLYETNARSIPDMLRQAADSIEEEASEDCSPTVAMVAVQISESGQVHVYGWGDTDDLRAIGLMERGKHSLLASIEELTA
jgi:hypothetical protein